MSEAGGTVRSATSWRRVWSIASIVLVAATAVGYPLIVYGLLSSGSELGSASTPPWRLAWLVAPLAVSLLLALRARGPWLQRLGPPVTALSLVLGALAVNSVQPLLLVPVVINATLLYSFGYTLWFGPPLIERFARLQHELTPAEAAWCRLWTRIWAVFFATNTLVAALLGATNQLHWWAVYNGLLTYVVMGCFFVAEYSIRKYRFGRYNSHPLDRLLRWCFERGKSPRHDR